MVFWRRHRSLVGTGVFFVSGGEPVEGCEPVTLLIVGESSDEAESQARGFGVWEPTAWDDMQIRPSDVELALADPKGFVWKPGRERGWRGSVSWPGDPDLQSG
jgi:hypothetical protein